MSKTFMNKRKTATAVIAVALCAVMIFGGTFAWQSIQQEALNEVSATVNPGGRLHDDFNEITDDDSLTREFNKDVYVENFTTLANNGVQVYARVRLDEYMEFGVGAGGLNDEGTAPSADNQANSLVPGAKLEDKSTWTTYRFGEDSEFRDYWTWDFDGQTIYMPTFNKNKDSLVADINGTFKNNFTDYTEYELDDELDGTAVYDKDANTEDEVGDSNNYQQYVDAENITIADETHTAKETINGYVISMQQWIDGGCVPGDYWVYDTDGWAYWANPIDPSTATGLLLDSITRTETIINQDWYYGVNVVAQFITKDDIGYSADGSTPPTGFYADDQTVSYEALNLLRKIGVEVTFDATDAASLNTALAAGGSVNLNGNTISGATAYAPTFTDSEGNEQTTNFAVNYAAINGAALYGGTLNIDAANAVENTDATYGLFLWTENGNGADNKLDVTVKDMVINNNDGAAKVAVYAQALNADIVMDNVTVNSTDGVGIAAEFEGFDLILDNCTVTQSGVTNSEKPWTQAAVVAWGNGSVVINSGTYTSADGWAAYVYNTGGSITINGGTFTGKLGCDAGSLVINGGTFSVDPSQYVSADCTVTDNGNGTWTVTK